MTYASGLPLGVASLAGYLKSHGVPDVEVLDANGAYLKRQLIYRFKQFIYQLKKKYGDMVFNLCPALGSHMHDSAAFPSTVWMDGPVRRSSESLIFRLHRKVLAVLGELFINVLERKNDRVPWSLFNIEKTIAKRWRGAEHRVFRGLFKKVFEKTDFDLIGFSVVYPEQLFFVLFIIKILKEEFHKKSRIVLGGPQVTEHIEEFKKGGGLLDLIDFFIEGDGEEPLLQLTQATRETLSRVPNLYVRDCSAGTFHRTHHRFDWDVGFIVVPDFEGFDPAIYVHAAPLLASKGCLWSKCHFCIRPTMQQHQHLSVAPEKVFEIMTCLAQRYGFSNYHFVDDALLPSFLDSFAEILIRNRFAPRWAFSAMIDPALGNRTFCEKLRRSGMVSITFGLESMSPRILGLMNKFHKNMTQAEVAKIFSALNQAGIRVGVHIIFGFPTETRDEANETLHFLLQNNDISMVSVQPFRLEAHTPMDVNPEKFNITAVRRENLRSRKERGYYYEVSSGMSHEEAVQFSKKAVKILKRAGKNTSRADCFFNTFPELP
jgi:anaerobic magnesium-protoporphyrin IX monomethyl ester cyclase